MSVKSHVSLLAPDFCGRGSKGKARMFPASSCVVIVLSRPSVLADMEGTVERPCKYVFRATLTIVWGIFGKVKYCAYHIFLACRDPKLVGGTIDSTFLFVVPRRFRIDWLRNRGTYQNLQLSFCSKDRAFFSWSFTDNIILKVWIEGSFILKPLTFLRPNYFVHCLF